MNAKVKVILLKNDLKSIEEINFTPEFNIFFKPKIKEKEITFFCHDDLENSNNKLNSTLLSDSIYYYLCYSKEVCKIHYAQYFY
jgi:hypothetical protein